MNVITTDQYLSYQTLVSYLKNWYMRDYSFLEKEKFLFKGQQGFRSKHSTTDALTDITERIRDVCDKEYDTFGAFLNFRKASDTVNHEILLDKLIHYGMRGQAVDWFQSFLSQRDAHQ